MKEVRKRHYSENSNKVYDAVKTRRQAITDKIWAYKSQSQCIECGESNPVMLEFDHLGDKDFNIATAAARGMSWSRIKAEIDKCEVVCANHHRVRTHMRAGWVRNIVVEA
jgi:hypothetical protein